MAGRTVQLRLGGHTYRVVTSASDEEIHRLAAMVNQKLTTVGGPKGRQLSPETMLLAAMSLAHDLEEERARSLRIRDRAREAFGRILARVDAALAEAAPPAAPSGDSPSPGSS